MVFLQSFSTAVPIPSYSSPLTSSILSLSPQKIFAETQTEVTWRLASLLCWSKLTAWEGDLAQNLFVAAASALGHTGISTQISIFRKICTYFWLENLPWFRIGLLKSREELAGNVEGSPSGWSNLGPNKLNSPWPHLLLSQPHYHLKGLPRTGRTAPLKINPQLALTIFIHPFSHPNPQYQKQRCVPFGFQAAQVQQKTIQKLEKICRNKKADDELIMYDWKVFYQHSIILWREGSVERAVVYLLFSTSAFIWYTLEGWNATTLVARRCTLLRACRRSCAWRHWSILLLNALCFLFFFLFFFLKSYGI